MAESPILFNTEMVKAITEGRKTQTRRVMKLKYKENEAGFQTLTEKSTGKFAYAEYYDEDENPTRMIEPPCRPDDVLWVRETWCENKNPQSDNFGRYEYRADYTDALCQDLITWQPSIHMPKEAARIFLRVKDVWPERLLDPFFKNRTAILTVRNEGVDVGETCRTCIETYGFPCCIDEVDDTECFMLDDPRYMFSKLWDSTIKPADLDKYGWKANPWVWVITFERCPKPEGWCKARS